MRVIRKTGYETLLLLAVLLTSAKVGFAAPPKSLNTFLDRHCLDCHDADVSKADLNLADLEFDLKDPAKFAIWQRVFERVRGGEMPPAKKPRPEAAELAELLPTLKEPLLAADRIDAKERGRVRSRRLTRREYEHTMHDLLGIDLPLFNQLAQAKPTQSDDYDYGLSDREKQVLEQMAQGLVNKEIAEVLEISPHTVVNHMRSIYSKLHVNTNTGAVAKAIREGLV